MHIFCLKWLSSLQVEIIPSFRFTSLSHFPEHFVFLFLQPCNFISCALTKCFSAWGLLRQPSLPPKGGQEREWQFLAKFSFVNTSPEEERGREAPVTVHSAFQVCALGWTLLWPRSRLLPSGACITRGCYPASAPWRVVEVCPVFEERGMNWTGIQVRARRNARHYSLLFFQMRKLNGERGLA